MSQWRHYQDEKINKQIKTHKTDAACIDDHFSQGSAATDLRGGDNFNSNFFRRSLMNLTVKKNWKLAHLCQSYSASKLARNLWHTVEEEEEEEFIFRTKTKHKDE